MEKCLCTTFYAEIKVMSFGWASDAFKLLYCIVVRAGIVFREGRGDAVALSWMQG